MEGRAIRVHRVPSQVPKSPQGPSTSKPWLSSTHVPPGLQVVRMSLSVPSVDTRRGLLAGLYQSWAPKASPRSFPAPIGLHLYKSQIFGSKKPQSQRQSRLSQLDKTYNITVHSRSKTATATAASPRRGRAHSIVHHTGANSTKSVIRPTGCLTVPSITLLLCTLEPTNIIGLFCHLHDSFVRGIGTSHAETPRA